jgi:hypothetical protein
VRLRRVAEGSPLDRSREQLKDDLGGRGACPLRGALRDIHVEIMTKARPLRMIFPSFVALIAPDRLLREVRVFGWSGPKIRSVSARVCWCSGWQSQTRGTRSASGSEQAVDERVPEDYRP